MKYTITDWWPISCAGVQFIKSCRGNQNVLQEGRYRYNWQKNGKLDNPKVYWRCSRRNKGCRACVYTVGSEIIARTHLHNH
ncbi:FLYWCH zinc finger domain-containing protein [Phthorimaea operculella]|nr:FLYWCH zinc finger domain-containing protein [Phthorimaea operculella]